MFTGIIEDIGTVVFYKKSHASLRLGILTSNFDGKDTPIGASIAVNGVCLTVTAWQNQTFYADVMPESVSLTNLMALREGAHVNLERALAVSGRLDGHIVAGHVDGMGTLYRKDKKDTSIVFTFEAPIPILDFIVYKGSIAINGISLTVSEVTDHTFSVSLIPHSLRETTMQYLQIGERVNLETDIIGRYIRKFLRQEKPSTHLKSEKMSLSFLEENGFL